MQIQWYPGHMAKARRLVESSLKLVDVVVELCDARAPLATRNPAFEDLFSRKSRALVLSKADLAEERQTRLWCAHFAARGLPALAFDARSRKGAQTAAAMVREAAKEKLRRLEARGQRGTVRAMIVGIPNVGKSTFINALKGKNAAKAQDRPGVTRGTQWIAVADRLEFLDTPGLLWPRLEDPADALLLAMLGSVPDQVAGEEELAARTLHWLWERKPEAVRERFRIDAPPEHLEEQLEAACRGRGWLLSGGRADLTRGARLVLDEFRAGRLGPITLQLPPEGA